MLKKKKYAGLKIVDFNDKGLVEQEEFKGLDSVRRDWSGISQKLGLDVARLLLSPASEEEVPASWLAHGLRDRQLHIFATKKGHA